MDSLPVQQTLNDNPRGGSAPSKEVVWYVEKSFAAADREQKCKVSRRIYANRKEQMELENNLIELARKERIKVDMKEYRDMCEIIITAIK
jgi:hypothetical protein